MKTLLFMGALGISQLAVSGNALAQQGGYGGGPGWQHPMMWGGGWFGGPVMIVFWLLILGLVIWGIRWAVRDRVSVGGQGGPSVCQGGEAALDVLKRRYASGEIERERYMEMKKDLEN